VTIFLKALPNTATNAVNFHIVILRKGNTLLQKHRKFMRAPLSTVETDMIELMKN
jgi:hypothetical protein